MARARGGKAGDDEPAGALHPVARSLVPCLRSRHRQPLDLRPGVGDVRLELRERPPDERAQPALREAFGERIDRREAIEVDEVLLPALRRLPFPGWSIVRGLSESGLPKTTTSSPVAKYFSMYGRFHHRQCSRAVPSSRISS